MNQMTFSDMEYSGRKRVTQKEKFLREMNEIIPWADWVNKIQPYLSHREALPSAVRDRNNAPDVLATYLVQPV